MLDTLANYNSNKKSSNYNIKFTDEVFRLSPVDTRDYYQNNLEGKLTCISEHFADNESRDNEVSFLLPCNDDTRAPQKWYFGHNNIAKYTLPYITSSGGQSSPDRPEPINTNESFKSTIIDKYIRPLDTIETDIVDHNVILCESTNQTDITHTDEHVCRKLAELKLKNSNRIIIGHLNINSIRYKFVDLKLTLNKNIDILLISETKLDSSFPSKQFLLDGYSLPYRLDREIGGEVGFCYL